MPSIPQDEQEKWLFVPAKLDDYPLDPESFRIYARIARRCGRELSPQAWDSVPNLSKSLRIGINTVRDRLKKLEDLNFIFRESRPGKTDRFGLCPPSQWRLPSTNEIVSTHAIVSTQKREPSRFGEGSGHENVRAVVTKSLDEGLPLKETPSEGSKSAGEEASPEETARWAAALATLRKHLGDQPVDNWFAKVHFVGVRRGIVHLSAAQITSDWIDRYYHDSFTEVLGAVGLPIGIRWFVTELAEKPVESADAAHAGNKSMRYGS